MLPEADPKLGAGGEGQSQLCDEITALHIHFNVVHVLKGHQEHPAILGEAYLKINIFHGQGRQEHRALEIIGFNWKV